MPARKPDDHPTKSDRLWAFIIGTGIALFPIHNQWLTNLVTKDGSVGFFLPTFGAALWIIGVLWFLLDRWRRWTDITWGDKCVFIPLLVIIVAIGLSGIPRPTLGSKLAPLFMGVCLLALYLATRRLGKNMFLPLAIGAVIGSLGILIFAILHPGTLTGGFVFERNYDIATGYILLGTAFFVGGYQRLRVKLAAVALLLSGSPEAVLPMLAVAVTVILRRDWSRKLLLLLVPLAILMGLYVSTGLAQKLYAYTSKISEDGQTVYYEDMDGVVQTASPISWRFIVIKRALTNLKPLGDGYNLTEFSIATVHNVPLIIVQQLGYPGILAGLAWLWVSLYCLVKTPYKYVWVLFIALSVWDHFIWTQMAPVWWAAVGLSVAGDAKSDLLFRGDTKCIR